MYEVIAFYVFSALTIGMFAIVVLSKNALYAMSALAGGMIFISGFFFILDAEFLGVVQITVYSGAIMALYAFGMMFFDTTRDVKEIVRSKKVAYTLSILSAVLLVVILCAPFFSSKVEALYPTIEKEYDLQFKYGNHNIHIRTLNLNTNWKNISSRLKDIIQINV